eukprot:TRINITY_DN1919_c0_g1_i3.p1 TRINITY_DN1919_c0_g1~~TRINITY_DN1919_c0_g1_i3.p1  ORF type:complete len:230 (-),score=82.52 TRINITY_DN1919_c0_g1_i3:515-1132(-)
MNEKNEELLQKYTNLFITAANEPPTNYSLNMAKLRKLILEHGLPEEQYSGEIPSICGLRGWIWKTFLEVTVLDAQFYIELNLPPACPEYEHVIIDAPRTFKHHNIFFARSDKTDAVARTLNAFFKALELKKPEFENYRCSYRQFLNTLIGPMLFVMPELDAWYCFSNFIRYHCPTYLEDSPANQTTGVKLGTDVCKLIFELYLII